MTTEMYIVIVKENILYSTKFNILSHNIFSSAYAQNYS